MAKIAIWRALILLFWYTERIAEVLADEAAAALDPSRRIACIVSAHRWEDLRSLSEHW